VATNLGLPDWANWLPLVVGFLSVLGLGLVGGFVWGHRQALRRARSGPVPEADAFLPPPPGTEEARDPWVKGSAGEQRQAQRRPGHPVAVLVSDADVTVEATQALVTDRSLGGLRMVLDAPVSVGTILSVRPASSELIPWVQVEVRSCRSGDTGWDTGCRFLKVPPTSILWSFG
jgi:hypothetical protein